MAQSFLRRHSKSLALRLAPVSRHVRGTWSCLLPYAGLTFFLGSNSTQYFDHLLGLDDNEDDVHPLQKDVYTLIEELCRIDTDLVTRIIPQLEHHINVRADQIT